MSTSSQFRREHQKERFIFTDPETGVKIAQITSFPTVSENLYFHSRSFTADGKTLIFLSMTEPRRGGIMDLYAADANGDGFRQLTGGKSLCGVALHPAKRVAYYATSGAVYEQDIDTGSAREIARAPDGVSLGSGGSMTDDGAILCMSASGTNVGSAIALVETESGTVRIVPADYSTAHLQIEPGEGKTAFYYGPKLPRIIDFATGVTHDVPLNRHNGHSAWLGASGRLYTGCIYGVARIEVCAAAAVATGPGHDVYDPRVEIIVDGPPYFWHPGCDATGEWIVSDSNWPDQGLWLINARTRKMARLCASGSSNSHPGWSHPHPAVAPGGVAVVFNSDRTGVPHVHVAEIPEALRASLRQA